MKKYSIIYFISFIFISCSPGYKNKKFQELPSQDKIKFQKYLIQGKNLYTKNCLSCHQENGEGVKKIIPPLASSDYLKNNQRESTKLIKYGATDNIIVNGISYMPIMPKNSHLTDLEIAEIITYINNSWGNEFGFVDSKQVKVFLE